MTISLYLHPLKPEFQISECPSRKCLNENTPFLLGHVPVWSVQMIDIPYKDIWDWNIYIPWWDFFTSTHSLMEHLMCIWKYNIQTERHGHLLFLPGLICTTFARTIWPLCSSQLLSLSSENLIDRTCGPDLAPSDIQTDRHGHLLFYQGQFAPANAPRCVLAQFSLLKRSNI